MKRIFFILSLALLTGCAIPKVMPYQKDSAVVHIKDSIAFRDSIILVSIEKEESSAVLPDTDTSHLETGIAESEAYVKDGKLYHSLRNKSEALLPVPIKLPKIIHQEYQYLIREKQEIVEVEKSFSMWQKFIQTLGYGLLGGTVLWIALKLRKILM